MVSVPGGYSSATMRNQIVRAAVAGLILSSPATSQSPPPYMATSLLVPGIFPTTGGGPGPGNASLATTAYVLQPNGNSADLLSLDISGRVQSSSASLRTVSSGVPFYDRAASSTATFTVSAAENGLLYAYVGDCASTTTSSSSSNAGVWTFTPPNSTASGPVGWRKLSTSAAKRRSLLSRAAAAGNTQPLFLGSSFAFSATLAPTLSQPALYVYGGMCPFANATAAAWQASAAYSNQMVRLTPSAGDPPTYAAAALPPSKGGPIAEAGFTLTGLTPSLLNRSSAVTQQANHVVLGGHTARAFVNMSTAAVWSLPEEAWTYVSIRPAEVTNTELALRAKKALTLDVESRSGHTAVLTEDGSAIVVLGGWVGDTSEAARPQLAVLHVGAAYGGDPAEKDWRWSVPVQQPGGPGIYAHAAALLPGNVMMVYGGQAVGSGGGKGKARAKKRQASGGGASPMFLNLTSMTWLNEYVNPAYNPSAKDGSPTAGGGNAIKIGLGVGLGLGIPLLILLVLAACCCHRRSQRRRHAARDEAVRALAQDASHFLHGDEEMVERNSGGAGLLGGIGGRSGGGPGGVGATPPWHNQAWYTGGHDPYLRTGAGRSLGYESLRGGSASSNAGGGRGGGNAPPPLRKHHPQLRAAKGLYMPPPEFAPGSSGSGATAGAGQIHPIYETDEEHDRPRSAPPGEVVALGDAINHRPAATPTSQTFSDPFLTPTGPTAPPVVFPAPTTTAAAAPGRSSFIAVGGPPNAAGAQDREVQDWVSDVDAADALLAARAASAAAVGTPGRRNSTRRSTGRISDPPARRASLRASTGSAPAAGSSSARNVAAAALAGTTVAGLAAAVAADDESQRTGSTLSEHSGSLHPHQNLQHHHHHRRAGSQGSSTALLTAFGSGTLTAVGGAGTEPRLGSSGGASNGSGGRGGGGAVGAEVDSSKSSTKSSTTNSYKSARSSFGVLQAEGPALLMGAAGGGVGDGARNRAGEAASAAAAVSAAAAYGQGELMLRGAYDDDDDDDDDYDAMAFGRGGRGRGRRGGGFGSPDDDDDAPGSPSKTKGLRRSWLGSIKRVFSGGGGRRGGGADSSSTTNASRSNGTVSPDGSFGRDAETPSPATAMMIDIGGGGGGGAAQGGRAAYNGRTTTSRASIGGESTGTADFLARPAPLVGGAGLLRRKQGREAWGGGGGAGAEGMGMGAGGISTGVGGAGNIHSNNNNNNNNNNNRGSTVATKPTTPGPLPDLDDDEDWDVERAVEQRLVQVMFTVPKERLRVVNAEIEREEEVVLVDPERDDDDDDDEDDGSAESPPQHRQPQQQPEPQPPSSSASARRASAGKSSRRSMVSKATAAIAAAAVRAASANNGTPTSAPRLDYDSDLTGNDDESGADGSDDDDIFAAGRRRGPAMDPAAAAALAAGPARPSVVVHRPSRSLAGSPGPAEDEYAEGTTGKMPDRHYQKHHHLSVLDHPHGGGTASGSGGSAPASPASVSSLRLAEEVRLERPTASAAITGRSPAAAGGASSGSASRRSSSASGGSAGASVPKLPAATAAAPSSPSREGVVAAADLSTAAGGTPRTPRTRVREIVDTIEARSDGGGGGGGSQSRSRSSARRHESPAGGATRDGSPRPRRRVSAGGRAE